MPALGELLRSDRPGQPSRGNQDGQDAGRRVRRGVELENLRGAAAVIARAMAQADALTEEISAPAGRAAVASGKPPALSVETIGLTKRFGRFTALDDVS